MVNADLETRGPYKKAWTGTTQNNLNSVRAATNTLKIGK